MAARLSATVATTAVTLTGPAHAGANPGAIHGYRAIVTREWAHRMRRFLESTNGEKSEKHSALGRARDL